MTRNSSQLLRLAGACGAAAFALTLFVAWHGTPIPGDIGIIERVQSWDTLRRNEGWINPLGSLQWQIPIVLAALTLAAFGHRAGLDGGSPAQRTEAIWLIIVAFGLRLLTGPLKELARAERPNIDFGLHVVRNFEGYGFPSGHVYSDVLIFGSIAIAAPILIGRTAGSAARVACLAVIALAGPARMVVGAHWPSDVAGGYLFGIAAVCLAVLAGKRIAKGV
jgi:undecaprenyl-diphosphatase